MGRVEAVIFASKEPVSRDVLARVVDPHCNLDLLIADLRAELRGRPYDLVAVAEAGIARAISSPTPSA
jgi:chromosome segregation and condensation protein ScpB